MRVVDGASGHFRVVKFNLGNKGDLMVPFIHNFIKDLSNDKVARLFLAGCHASIYIAHYEKIVQEGMSWLTALVMIVIIVVVAYYAYPMLKAGFGAMMTTFANMAAASTLTGALGIMIGSFISSLPTMLIKMAAQYIIQVIITEIAGDNPELAMMLNLISMVAVAAWNPGVGVGAPPGSFGTTGGWQIGQGGGSLNTLSTGGSTWGVNYTGMSFDIPNFSDLGIMDFAKIAIKVLNFAGDMVLSKSEDLAEELAKEQVEFGKYKEVTAAELAGKTALLDDTYFNQKDLTKIVGRYRATPNITAAAWNALNESYYAISLGEASHADSYLKLHTSVEHQLIA